MDSEEIYAVVADRYSTLSSNALDSEGAYGKSVAQSFGYSLEDLESIPAQSNLGSAAEIP